MKSKIQPEPPFPQFPATLYVSGADRGFVEGRTVREHACLGKPVVVGEYQLVRTLNIEVAISASAAAIEKPKV